MDARLTLSASRSNGVVSCSPQVRQQFGYVQGLHRSSRCQLPRARPPTRVTALFGGWRPSDVKPEFRNSDGPRPNYLYDPSTGLPIIREKLSYGQLLEDIRTEKVKEVRWFSHEGRSKDVKWVELEGACVVVYHDGRVKQSYVPREDVRVMYAMESHGVMGGRLLPTIDPSLLAGPTDWSDQTKTIINQVIPVMSILAIYAAAQYAAKLKGDAEDREKIRMTEAAERRRKKLEDKVDTLTTEAYTLANMGLGAEEIMKQMKALQIEITREEVDAIVADAQAKLAKAKAGPQESFNTDAAKQLEALAQRKKEEEEKESGEMEQAERMLQMSTVKVRRAKDPRKERLRMKEIQSKLKNLKLQYTDEETVFFDDVAGLGDARYELEELVDFFRDPKQFKESGARIPKGVLLCGPPGTGKTLLARAVAGESGAAFLSVNASEFVEMFVGVGAARVRDLFNQAKALAPAIIFIDEIDAVGRVRGGAQGNDERDQTLNQLLSMMDGFDEDTGVIVMGATNRKDVLDPALIRPGRFDRIIFVGLPDFEGRIEVLNVHLKNKPVEPNVSLRDIAFETIKYSGAQLANLVNTAAMIAGREGRESIAQVDLVAALDYERLGPAKQLYNKDAQKRIAVQEGATCLLASLLPAIEPVAGVTIVPREKYPLGNTVLKVNEAREFTKQFTRRYLEEQLVLELAGMAAEKIVFGSDEVSTLNQRRIANARRIVTKLVASGAMSDHPDIGSFRTLSTPIKGGGRALRQIVFDRTTYQSNLTADQEMQRLLDEGLQTASDMVERNRAALDRLVEAILEKKVLEGDEVRQIVAEFGNPEDLERRRREEELAATEGVMM